MAMQPPKPIGERHYQDFAHVKSDGKMELSFKSKIGEEIPLGTVLSYDTLPSGDVTAKIMMDDGAVVQTPIARADTVNASGTLYTKDALSKAFVKSFHNMDISHEVIDSRINTLESTIDSKVQEAILKNLPGSHEAYWAGTISDKSISPEKLQATIDMIKKYGQEADLIQLINSIKDKLVGGDVIATDGNGIGRVRDIVVVSEEDSPKATFVIDFNRPFPRLIQGIKEEALPPKPAEIDKNEEKKESMSLWKRFRKALEILLNKQ